ncbi:hypothetical protein BGX31_002970 [Mortierella sp. GBA43]|nr:hypothetical protein BGX31_002970 [Mortierella sp. GBA43]
MTLTNSFMLFGSIEQEPRILWISPTVYDILGYEPEELIGAPVYTIVSPDGQSDIKEFRKECFVNDLIASQTVLRLRRKDGRTFPSVGLANICYDFTAEVITTLDPGAKPPMPWRAHSIKMNRRTAQKKEEFERMKRHQKAFAGSAWNYQAMEPEARVCLIINRFTRNLIVMYASAACENVLHVDPDEITGNPILLYIRSDDMAPFVEQVDLVKSMSAVSQMRFWFQAPDWPEEIPCEAIIVGTTDGIMVVVRECRPFVRKKLIASRDQFENRSRGSPVSSRRTRPYASPSASKPYASPSSHLHGSFGPRRSPMRNVSGSFTGNNQPRMSEEMAAPKKFGYQEVVAHDYEECVDVDDEVEKVVRGMAVSKLVDNDVVEGNQASGPNVADQVPWNRGTYRK